MDEFDYQTVFTDGDYWLIPVDGDPVQHVKVRLHFEGTNYMDDDTSIHFDHFVPEYHIVEVKE